MQGHAGVLLAILLPMACPACFHIEPRATDPGMVPLKMDCAFLHQSLIMEMPYNPAYNPIICRHFFFSRDFLFSDDS